MRKVAICGTALVILCAGLLAFDAGAQQTAPGAPGATTNIDGRYLPNPPQTQANDLAAKMPDTLRDMQQRFNKLTVKLGPNEL